MMDQDVAQKLIELSVNVNNLNVKVMALTQQVEALMDVASAQARHWHRAQQSQSPNMAPQMGQGPQEF